MRRSVAESPSKANGFSIEAAGRAHLDTASGAPTSGSGTGVSPVWWLPRLARASRPCGGYPGSHGRPARVVVTQARTGVSPVWWSGSHGRPARVAVTQARTGETPVPLTAALEHIRPVLPACFAPASWAHSAHMRERFRAWTEAVETFVLEVIFEQRRGKRAALMRAALFALSKLFQVA